MTRLWKLHIGWDTNPSSSTTPVCAQRCSSCGVPASTLRPHLWRPCSPPLAACIPQRVDYKVAVMAFRIVCLYRRLHLSASSCCWSAWSSLSALILITPAAGSSISSIATGLLRSLLQRPRIMLVLPVKTLNRARIHHQIASLLSHCNEGMKPGYSTRKLVLMSIQGGPKKYATTNFSKNRIKDCQRD